MTAPITSEVQVDSSVWLTAGESSLFRTLLYFDIFNFPLTRDELWAYCNFERRAEMENKLQKWIEKGQVLRKNDFYMLGSYANKVQQRLEDTQRAEEMMGRARANSALIQSFPFVKATFISGSLSKGVVSSDGDVDYFIITQPGKLWIARTLLALYKKIVLFGSHRYFCINYFIDARHLEIEEKNIFTATEMATLIPMAGNKAIVRKFFRSNQWVVDFFPHFHPREMVLKEGKARNSKKIFEGIFNMLDLLAVDFLLRKFTTFFWKIKFYKMPRRDFKISLKSNKHVSKHHPRDYQRYVLETMEKKIVAFEENSGLKLSVS